MYWGLLLISVVLEVAWVISLRYTEGYTQLWPSIISTILVVLDVYILGLVFKGLPTSIAYPVWVSLGMVGTVLMSHILFKDAVTLTNVLFIALILLGVIGLKITSSA